MMAATALPVSFDLADWPCVALRVRHDGVILASNGHLEELLGVPVVGEQVEHFLDEEASRTKWQRLATDGSAGPWELIFCTGERMLATGRYSVLREAGDSAGARLLLEHPPTPRLAELATQVARIDTELSTAQRALVIERARLASALGEAERSNVTLDEFAHAVSHDLKAPVRAIREYAELLLDPGLGTPADAGEAYLRRILDLTGRMRQMIDAALEYARAGRTTSRVERLDTREVLEDLIQFLAPPADVTIRLAPGLPVIESERVPFEQVFRNLLSNAITYRRREAAHVDVSASDRGACWEFVVADDGPGITPNQQERIWKLFQTTRPGEGTGLGLALVKRLVEARQGKVFVRSTPGEGAAFHVQWPKHSVQPTTARASNG
ncbi:MAG TPA: HAMP domain-containing sensor histidine kinase [Gemmatimonadaceae bacterium]|nr:HAMP domain-containing sensor histidine kinase [Gemmatimonadaceae bacterium]